MRSVQEICAEAFQYTRDGNFDAAEAVYESLLTQMDRGDANVLFGYGSLLAQRGKFGLAITLLRGALAHCDTFAPIWNNLAAAYRHAGRKDQSLVCLERALAIDPNCAETLASLGGHYLNSDQSEIAESYSRKALEIENISGAHMHLGMALLEQGRFEEAWPHYEGRWGSLDNIKNVRPYKAPRWTGEPVKRLAIHGEQGLGDEILFMSLFRNAAERAESIVIECADRLIPLFERSFGVPCYPDHASLIAAEGEPDAYIPMGSLPGVLGLPDGKPYLQAKPTMRKTSRPRIGLAWAGGVARTNRDDRSMALAEFRPILDSVKADFVSVQYGGADVQAEAERYGLETTARDFDTLTSTIASCDLVITVCQTALHQAGALGIPCWVLVPRKAPWVVCQETMPWYNSVSLFRQDVDGAWGPVIERVSGLLREKFVAKAA